MKTLQINDDVYESLKAFVVDPFDDTPNAVLMRLIDIANKAQSRWCPFSPPQKTQSPEHANNSVPPGTRIPDTVSEGTAVML
jgi:hypothetical protein